MNPVVANAIAAHVRNDAEPRWLAVAHMENYVSRAPYEHETEKRGGSIVYHSDCFPSMGGNNGRWVSKEVSDYLAKEFDVRKCKFELRKEGSEGLLMSLHVTIPISAAKS